MNYYYCQEGDSGVCKIGAVAWTIPLELTSDASAPTAADVPLMVQ